MTFSGSSTHKTTHARRDGIEINVTLTGSRKATGKMQLLTNSSNIEKKRRIEKLLNN
jgi:hypothetical protein